jgi:3-methylfumaryl-CoA hydratase
MDNSFADWIGRSVTREDVVTPRLLAEYRATLGGHLFESGDDACPPGFHFGLAPATPAAGETGPDGAEAKGLFLPPIPLQRRMWAGGRIENIRAPRIGMTVKRTSTVADIKFREGSAGQLYVVTVAHEISDADGLLVRERQDLIFRGGAPKSVAAPAASPDPDPQNWKIDPTPLLLFRFSAFTFNGHRIHYDHNYAAEEGYPGLVVHGPLQAALMLNMASARLGQVPADFSYRCVAPLFSGPPFSVHWSKSGSCVRIVRHDGVITAEGQAPVRDT